MHNTSDTQRCIADLTFRFYMSASADLTGRLVFYKNTVWSGNSLFFKYSSYFFDNVL